MLATMYTIKQAAARTGVSIPVLRAWQRRYGVVDPERTAAGYRLYSEDDIARVRAMRLLVDSGWSAREAAASVLRQPADGVRRAAQDAGAEPEALVERFMGAAARLDAAGVESVLDEMAGLGSFEAVSERGIFPALVAVGAAWERGELDVAAEHAASHAILRRLASAFEAAGRPIVGERPVLIGLPPGARHELGALAFAVAARRAGLPVLYLGADLPVANWIEATVRTSARAAVMAIPTVTDREAGAAVISALQAAAPRLLVAVGGAGASTADLDERVVVLPSGLSDAAAALLRSVGP